MNRFQQFLVAFLVLLTFAFSSSCDKRTQKEAPTPTADSTWWSVNTDNFYTLYPFVSGDNNSVLITGNSDNTTGGTSGSSNFSITFHLPYIPAHGSYLLDCSSHSASAACMQITYKGFNYRTKPAQNAHLQADSANQKAKLLLPPTYFYNTIMPTDSVVVNGVFFQP